MAETFGSWLKERRRALDLTQGELAAQVGCSAALIHKMEGDVRRPSRQVAGRLAECLRIPEIERERFAAWARGAQSAADYVPSPLPAADAMPAPNVFLPSAATPLLGREEELAKLGALLTKPTTRLVTLTGAPGIGKTRLALGAASLPGIARHFHGGVYFVALAGVTDPGLVLPTIASTVGVKANPPRPLLATLSEALDGRQLLLVLDNFEQVIAAAASIADLLQDTRGITLLVTSRQALRIRTEVRVQVPPLAVPVQGTLPPDDLESVPSVALFLDRARAASPDFDLTRANAQAVASICQRLDGLPLAIEIAAARVALLSPATILARLEKALPLLTDGPTDLPLRQQTLSAAINWSYDLLRPEEQRLFSWLSVFVGGWTLRAAEAVAQGSGGTRRPVLDSLSVLALQSLVQISGQQTEQERFNMLQVIREYAQERLAASGDEERVRNAHAHYFMQFAEEGNQGVRGTEQSNWLDVVDLEHENIRAALAWATGAGNDPTMALRIGASMWFYWYLRDHMQEGLQWLEIGLRRGDVVEPPVRSDALNGAGVLANYMGRTLEAIAWHKESLAIRLQLGDKSKIVSSLNNLGLTAEEQSDYALAGEYYAQSLAIASEIGNKRSMANATNNLAGTAYYTGDYARSIELYREGLALYKELNLEFSVATSMVNLGQLARVTGDLDGGQQLLEQAITLLREGKNERPAALAEVLLGEVLQQRGRKAEARALVERGLQGLRDTGSLPWVGVALNVLGRVESDAGNYTRAEQLLKEAVQIQFQQRGHRVGVADALDSLAVLASVLGDYERAICLWSAATALREAIGSPREPLRREEYESEVALVRSQMSEADFARAWGLGHGMTVDEAVSYALSSPEHEGVTPATPRQPLMEQVSHGASSKDQP